MEAIRRIQRIANGELHLQLPESFWGKEVEIIILATSATESPVTKARDSRRDALKQDAKPERLRLGTALSELGHRAGLTDDDIVAFEQVRDKTPAKPLRFE